PEFSAADHRTEDTSEDYGKARARLTRRNAHAL
ncbi:unnamed protein product, partial [marine sediment metagenome]